MCASMRVCVWVLVYLCICVCVHVWVSTPPAKSQPTVIWFWALSSKQISMRLKKLNWWFTTKKLFSSLYIWNQKKRERIQLRWKDFICFDRMGRKMILNFVSSILMSWCIWHQNQQKEEKEDEEPSPLVLLRRRFLGLLVEGLQCGLVAAKISKKVRLIRVLDSSHFVIFGCFYFFILKNILPSIM